ncbi:MAG: ABC transporter permease [Methanobacteriaceae archaeon]|jgi:putative ABC transport system permease protein|nr:ABC transporter permease [Methanobacteriaceae archaeon]
MSYLSLILKNPFRNKTRSSLAIIGIAIGIATIVGLGLLTGGLKASTESTLKAGAAEITVVQANSGMGIVGSTGTIDESRVADIQELSGVKDVAGVLTTTYMDSNSSGGSFRSGQIFITGINSNKLNLANIESVNGTIFSNGNTNEIIMGKTASENLNKTVGDTINLFGTEFKITGTFESGNIMTDSGIFMSLDTLQSLTNKTGTVSTIYVKIADNANVTTVSKAIDNAYPNELSASSAAAQANRMNEALSTIDTATWAISLLAIFIGAVGVINTMIMSVYERTREIGVLKAVGWKERRILGMILGESIVLTLIAAVVGSILGIVAVTVGLMLISNVGSVITPVYSVDLFLRAFAVALFVGIIGGIYPAYRASRLPPTEALRYE